MAAAFEAGSLKAASTGSAAEVAQTRSTSAGLAAQTEVLPETGAAATVESAGT